MVARRLCQTRTYRAIRYQRLLYSVNDRRPGSGGDGGRLPGGGSHLAISPTAGVRREGLLVRPAATAEPSDFAILFHCLRGGHGFWASASMLLLQRNNAGSLGGSPARPPAVVVRLRWSTSLRDTSPARGRTSRPPHARQRQHFWCWRLNRGYKLRSLRELPGPAAGSRPLTQILR